MTARQPHHRTRFAAWLSLFAMLMIFVGPLIAQGTSMAHGTGMGASMSMADRAACDDMPGMAHGASGSHHEMAIWEKCGYCSLLFQHPPLTQSHTVIARLRIAAPRYLSSSFTPQQAAPPVFPGARTRAPPLSAC